MTTRVEASQHYHALAYFQDVNVKVGGRAKATSTKKKQMNHNLWYVWRSSIRSLRDNCNLVSHFNSACLDIGNGPTNPSFTVMWKAQTAAPLQRFLQTILVHKCQRQSVTNGAVRADCGVAHVIWMPFDMIHHSPKHQHTHQPDRGALECVTGIINVRMIKSLFKQTGVAFEYRKIGMPIMRMTQVRSRDVMSSLPFISDVLVYASISGVPHYQYHSKST